MYRLIIVDDEKRARDNLSNLVDWKSMGYEIVGVFGDGSEVLELLEDMFVDVILSDIAMPHISGIDIASYVYSHDLPCKVVFISAHKDFQYALKGLQYGVEDYIVKPFGIDEIETVFKKIKEKLDIITQKSEYQRHLRDRWNEIFPDIENKIIRGIVTGALNDMTTLELRMNQLYPSVDLKNSSVVLADMEILDYQDFIINKWKYYLEQFDVALNNVIRFSNDEKFTLIAIYKYKGKFRLFGIEKKYFGDLFLEENDCAIRIENLKNQLSEIFKVNVLISYVRKFENIYQFVEAREIVVWGNGEKETEELYIQEQKKSVMTYIMNGNIDTAQKIVIDMIKTMDEDDTHYRNQLFVDILSKICDFLEEYNYRLYQQLKPYMDYKSVLEIQTSKELIYYCNCIFEKMKSKEGMENSFDKKYLINFVREYVDDHIFENITLEEIANEVYLSASHLGKVFKKQTGEAFVQHVHKRKMEKAELLLKDPKLKIYQISDMLGYKTAWYFSKLFYNHTGLYPSQYRKEVLHIE